MHMYYTVCVVMLNMDLHVCAVYTDSVCPFACAADNEALREQLSQLEAKEKGTAQELRELQIKMRGVTEYFQEKESGLHRKIELGEINQEKFKSLESEAQEKAAASELEREREKEELKELRKQMADIEKSFISQLKSNEERAEDALVSELLDSIKLMTISVLYLKVHIDDKVCVLTGTLSLYVCVKYV